MTRPSSRGPGLVRAALVALFTMDNVTDPKHLTNIYKKNGLFDKQRRKLLEDFKGSETHANLMLKLKVMVENKVKQDPSILMRNKGKMAALIQGEVFGSSRDVGDKSDNSVLGIVDKDIQEKLIESPEFHSIVKQELRDIKRRQEGVSDEAFALELAKEKAEKQEKLRHSKITKAPRFNIRGSRSERDDRKERDDKTNVTQLMY